MTRRLIVAALAWSVTATAVCTTLRAVYGERTANIHVRWAPSVGEARRAELERDYGLAHGEPREATTWRYTLTNPSKSNITALVRDPLAEDTHYIDRARFRLAGTAPRGGYLRGGMIPPLLELAAVALLAVGGLALALAMLEWTRGVEPLRRRLRPVAEAVSLLPAARRSRAVEEAGPPLRHPVNGARAATSRPARIEQYGLLVVIVGLLAFSSAFIARSSFTIGGERAFSLFDDAMISMTYARNFAGGYGLVWNADGPRVEGITNPLWTAVMTGIHLTGVTDRYAALPVMLLGAGLLVVCAWLAYSIARRLYTEAPIVGLVAAAAVAFNYALAYWTLRGMEVGLVTAFALGGTLCCLHVAKGRTRAIAPLAAVSLAGILTRLDFAIFVVVFAGFLALRTAGDLRRHALQRVLGVVAVGFLGQGLARRAYYGAWLPNTYYLKIDGFPVAARLERGLATLWDGLVDEWGVVFGLAILGLGLMAGCSRARRIDSGLPIAAFGGTALYSVWVGGDAWEWMGYSNRYLTPGIAVLSCTAAVGLVRFARHLSERRGNRVLIGTVLAAAALTLLALYGAPDAGLLRLPAFSGPLRASAGAFVVALTTAAMVRRRFTVNSVILVLTIGALGSLSLRQAASWLAENGAHVDDDASAARMGDVIARVTTPDARIAVVWAGAPIYFSHRTGVDLLGKSDSRIARQAPRPGAEFWPGHSKWDLRISIGRDEPDLIAQLWKATQADIVYIEDEDYVPVFVDPTVDTDNIRPFMTLPMFAKVGSPRLDWTRLQPVDRATMSRLVASLPET